MVQSLTQKLVKQLEKSNLTTEDRIVLTTALLQKLNAPPIGELITFTEGGLMINGKQLDIESLLAFREATSVLRDNYARKVIFEQVKYKAIELGIDKGISTDTIMFSKAAIWVINELEILVHRLSDQTQ